MILFVAVWSLDRYLTDHAVRKRPSLGGGLHRSVAFQASSPTKTSTSVGSRGPGLVAFWKSTIASGFHLTGRRGGPAIHLGPSQVLTEYGSRRRGVRESAEFFIRLLFFFGFLS